MKFRLFIFLSLFFTFFSVSFVFAKQIDYGLSVTSKIGNLSKAYRVSKDSDGPSLVDRLGGGIGVALSFVGLIFLVLIIYGGFLWMTASGNAQQVDKAIKVVVWAVLGIFIVFASFAIVEFIGNQATKKTIPDTPEMNTSIDIPDSNLDIIKEGDEPDIFIFDGEFDSEDDFYDNYDLSDAFLTCLGDSYDFEKHERCLCIVYGEGNCIDILGP